MKAKKIFIIILLFTFFILLTNTVNVKATVSTSNEILVTGAQVRTNGKIGIRFVGKTEGNYDKYGITIAYGEVDTEEIVLGNIVSNKDVLFAETSEKDENNQFYITLIDIPEEMYLQNVTARAYVKKGNDIIYSTDSVTRNLIEVTTIAYQNGNSGENIENVLFMFGSEFKKMYLDSNNNYIIESVYEYDYVKLGTMFINDYNKYMNASLTVSGMAKSLMGKYGDNQTKENLESSNLYLFFNKNKMIDKWGWLIDYIISKTSNTNGGKDFCTEQWKLIKGTSTNYSSWWGGRHLLGRIEAFFTATKNTDTGFTSSEFTNIEVYNDLVEIINNLKNGLIFAEGNYLYGKVGNEITLPDKIQGSSGTEFDGWYLNNTKYNANSNYLLTSSNVVFKPKFVLGDLVSVNASFDLAGGQWDSEMIINNAPVLKEAKLTDYLTYQAATGYEAALHNKVPAKYWKYIPISKTSIDGLYKIEQIVDGSANVTSSYDLVIMWHSALTDSNSKTVLESLYKEASKYVGAYVFFENVPSSSTSAANISMKVISNDCTSFDYTKVFVEEEVLPIPVRSGFDFKGWLCNIDGKLYNKYPSYISNPGDITYTAQWEPQSLKYASTISYETNSYVNVGNNIKLNVFSVGTKNNVSGLTWSSSDNSIATVDSNGNVKGVSKGFVTIKASVSQNNYVEFGVTVIDNTIQNILKTIISGHQSNVFTEYNLGIGAGTPVYYMDIIGSVNDILFNDSLVINDKYLSKGNSAGNNSGNMSSIDFVTVHYTGNMSAGANANANASYFVSSSNSSIHYTTGNDGVYHCLDDNKWAWHAGASQSFSWRKTNVVVKDSDPKYPVWGINSNSNFTINGVDTGIKVPYEEKRGYGYVTQSKWLNQMGLAYKIGSDGYYYMGGATWVYSQVYEGRICSTGGNNNSIGIESCVDKGSDLWYTWHKTAQLCAKLLNDNNLDITRLVGHHFFTAKDCPQPLLENNNEIWNIFREMVEKELELLQKYSNYSITMEVISGSADNKGRVTQNEFSSLITYKVTVKNKNTNVSETITLSSIIEGYNSK